MIILFAIVAIICGLLISWSVAGIIISLGIIIQMLLIIASILAAIKETSDRVAYNISSGCSSVTRTLSAIKTGFIRGLTRFSFTAMSTTATVGQKIKKFFITVFQVIVVCIVLIILFGVVF